MIFARVKNGLIASYALVDNRDIFLLADAPYEKLIKTGVRYGFEDVDFLPPCEPTKIIAVGLNYTDHAWELNMSIPDEPVIFLKALSSLSSHESIIGMPPQSKQVDYEGELAIVIGKDCRNVEEKDATNYIFGYTCANDVTARDIQKIDGQWARAKSFDGFCPVGPFIVNGFNKNAKIKTYMDGQVVQNSTLDQRIFSNEFLVSFISKVMTLNAGDIILTGTPPGVGPIAANAKVEVEIEGIGTLKNKFVR